MPSKLIRRSPSTEAVVRSAGRSVTTVRVAMNDRAAIAEGPTIPTNYRFMVKYADLYTKFKVVYFFSTLATFV